MLRLGQILEATGGRVLLEGAGDFSGLSIDSRTIGEGELFLALRGDRFDGHDFVTAALRIGAGALIDNPALKADAGNRGGKTIILVENTLRALHDIARHMRKGFKGPVVGVVGSNGKTTTKEIISSILATRLRVLKTRGNLNNHIGMPLSVTELTGETDVMVLEMGTNRPGDVDGLCAISSPGIGVITNIGYEHLEGFGSLESVRDSELEILPYVKKVIVNGDDAFLMEGVRKAFSGEVAPFGIETDAGVLRVRDVAFLEGGTRFHLCSGGDDIRVNSHLPGRFNLYNCLAAASTALAMGFSLQEIRDGIESFRGVGMRFETVNYDGVTFLNDAYNANPSSMEASLQELVRLSLSSPSRRALVVLGDMLELGDYAVTAHRKLGQVVAKLPVDSFIGVGPLMEIAVSESGGKGVSLTAPEEAAGVLRQILREGDFVLIKGSRGMKMERVLTAIKELPGQRTTSLVDRRG